MVVFILQFLGYLKPWQPSFLVVVFFVFFAVAYIRGNRLKADGFWRQLSFWLGLSLAYIVLYTRFDYYAQYMFFMHRIQHLALHHLGPFFICLAAPWSTILRGITPKNSPKFTIFIHNKIFHWLYVFFQNPIIAVSLFVGLIALWLDPEIHFYAMLNEHLYQLMNWSMFIDGLLFWWLILDPMSKSQGARVGFGGRILMLIAIVPPQIFIGAHITFAKDIIYDIYSVCGRAWPMAPMDDQMIGGIITWIPATMMSVVAMIVVLHHLLHDDSENKNNNKKLDNLTHEPLLAINR